MVELVQMPWRSGWPSAVRGGVQDFAVAFASGAGAWETAWLEKSVTAAQRTGKPFRIGGLLRLLSPRSACEASWLQSGGEPAPSIRSACREPRDLRSRDLALIANKFRLRAGPKPGGNRAAKCRAFPRAFPWPLWSGWEWPPPHA